MHPSQTAIADVELQTHLEHSALSMSHIERFADGSGYSCTLHVKSGDFSCTRRFYFSEYSLSGAIVALQSMSSGMPGEAALRGDWEDDVITLAVNRLGHVVVSGEIFEHAVLSQSLKFAFRTDQTVLGPLLRGLAAIRGA